LKNIGLHAGIARVIFVLNQKPLRMKTLFPKKLRCILAGIVVLLFINIHAKAQTTINLPAGQWSVPAGVTSITVYTYGAGGGSGGAAAPTNYTTLNASAGGGGGACAIKTLTVSPGDIYTVTVGSGGTAGSCTGGSVAANAGGTGGTSTFTGPGGTVSASGGAGGTGASGNGSTGVGGPGGNTGTYTTIFNGGKGANGVRNGYNWNCGGGGGGGAGNAGAGGISSPATSSTTSSIGGTAGSGTPNTSPYKGAAGSTAYYTFTGSSSPVAGVTPGGGAAGCASIAGTPSVGAAGGNGQVLVVYTISVPPTAYAMTGGGPYCEPGAGMPVGLANSQAGVTYTLYQGATPLSPTYAGTGAAIPMGTRLGTFVYSVVGVGNGGAIVGTTPMSSTATVTLHTMDIITFNALANACVGDPAITLNSSPAGGVYSGNPLYLSGSTFNPSAAGSFPITYNYNNSFGCPSVPVTQTLTVNVCTPTWSGLVDNNWLTPHNWVGDNIPGTTGDAIIPVGCPNYPVIGQTQTIHVGNVDVYGTAVKSTLSGGMTVIGELDISGNLTIRSSGSVDVSADGALTVDGNLSIIGSLLVESQGSLITNGGVTGTATIQRNIPNNLSWHFLSSPVSNQPICNGVFAPTYPGTFPGNPLTWDFYNWLPGECDANLHWRNLRTAAGGANNVDFPLLSFQDSRGYLVAYNSTWGVTKSFVGTPNTADRALAFYDVTNLCSWALPGNPFPSAVQWSGVTLKENLVAPYYYIWNDVTMSYEWWGDDTHFGGVKVNGNIPAEQGFFVKILPSGTLHLNIPNSARIHDNGTDTWIKESVANRLKLTIANGTSYSDFAYVMFEDNCNIGQDRKDAEKMFSMSTAVPQIYTIINNDLKACSNSLPYINNGTIVPVGFVAPIDGNYCITVDMSSFASLTGLSIEDLQLNVNQDLKQNPVYTFHATGNEDAGRFLLHFAGAIGIDEKGNSAINIYSNEKTVFISCAAGFQNATVTISNLLGQEIVNQNLNNQKTNQVKVNALKGYYIVKVQDASSVKTAKVYIN